MYVNRVGIINTVFLKLRPLFWNEFDIKYNGRCVRQMYRVFFIKISVYIA